MRREWVLLGVLVVTTGCSSGGSASSDDFCEQSAEAAHYIAAESINSEDVVRVTNDVIAERKYPLLGDKLTAFIGSSVALRKANETPDEIASHVKESCSKQVSN